MAFHWGYMENQIIRISCDVQTTISDLNQLHELQGELKSLSEENYAKLKQSILEHGFHTPIAVWDDGDKLWIVDGHQRKRTLLCMEQEGFHLPNIPVIRIRAFSLQEAAQILLTMVSVYGKVQSQGLYEYQNTYQIDVKVLEQRYDLPNLDMEKYRVEYFDDPKRSASTDEDEVPEVKHDESRTKLGDIYILGNHKLLCGDSTQISCVEALMNGEKVDMVFTDPPYGIGLKYQTHDDSEEKWFDLINKTMKVIQIINPSFTVMPCCRIKALSWWYLNHKPDWIMCWYKGSPGHCSYIGFNDWEPHLVWGKPKNQMHDYWQTRCGFEIEGHPCPKPIEYCQWILERAVNNQDSVLDLFGGSGSTLIACEKTNRRCFMMELDRHYCDVIVDRYLKYVGQTKVIKNGVEVDWFMSNLEENVRSV